MLDWLQFAIIGALGAIISDMLGDGYIELPKVQDKKFYPGFIGGLLTGTVIGYLVDKSPLTAFTFGYIGKEAIDFLLKKEAPIIK
jgi:hypothetical protein